MGKEDLDGYYGPVLHFKLKGLIDAGGSDAEQARKWIKSHPGILTMFRGDTLGVIHPSEVPPRTGAPNLGVNTPEKQDEQEDQTDFPDPA